MPKKTCTINCLRPDGTCIYWSDETSNRNFKCKKDECDAWGIIKRDFDAEISEARADIRVAVGHLIKLLKDKGVENE